MVLAMRFAISTPNNLWYVKNIDSFDSGIIPYTSEGLPAMTIFDYTATIVRKGEVRNVEIPPEGAINHPSTTAYIRMIEGDQNGESISVVYASHSQMRARRCANAVILAIVLLSLPSILRWTATEKNDILRRTMRCTEDA